MPLTLKLDPDLEARARHLAKVQGRPLAAVLEDAVRAYVDDEEWYQGKGRSRAATGFEDRPQDEIAGGPGPADATDAPRLRHWSEVLTFVPDPNPDPEREEAWKRFESLRGAGAATSGYKNIEDVNAYIRWLRDDD